jgi:hypothetical protein
MKRHEVETDERQYFSTLKVYFARCTGCDYVSGKHASQAEAEQAGQNHANAKNGHKDTNAESTHTTTAEAPDTSARSRTSTVASTSGQSTESRRPTAL